jgi:hypothetical protein
MIIDTVFIVKCLPLTRAGLRQDCRPVKTTASASGPAAVALRAPFPSPLTVLTRPAARLASRPAQTACCSSCSGAGARYGSCFFTIAQARCSNVRAVAQRATFVGFPAARKR